MQASLAHAAASARTSRGLPCAVPRRSYLSGQLAVQEFAWRECVGALCS